MVSDLTHDHGTVAVSHPRLHASGLLFHRMIRSNNTQEIDLGSMDYQVCLPAMAAFAGYHLTNGSRALRKRL